MTEHLFERESGNFLKLYFSAFTFPFRGMGWLSLLLGAIALWLARGLLFLIPLFGLLMGVLMLIYLVAYLMDVIHASAHGEELLPDWPGASDPYGDIARPFLLCVATLIFCAVPVVVLLLASTSSNWRMPKWALIAAGAAGAFYAPMALLCVVVADSVAGLNPVLVIGAIVRVPLQYLAACAVLVLAWLLVGVVGSYVPEVFLLGSLFRVFLSLYCLTVLARVIGLIYWVNRYRLGWFRP